MQTKLRAFHGDEKIKEKYLARVKEHARLDNIIKGQYWQYGKGCAVGCTIQCDSHLAYEIELGIPSVIARLEDIIFEKMNNNKAKTFPVKFLSSINTGADLSLVWPKFVVWLLDDPIDGVGKYITEAKPAFNKVVDGYKRMIVGEDLSSKEWLDIREDSERERIGAASAAANYASAAAIYAANSAVANAIDNFKAAYAYAAYAYAVDDLVKAAAHANAAYNAYKAYKANANTANAIDDYNAAYPIAEAKNYNKQAIKLLELLKSAK